MQGDNHMSSKQIRNAVRIAHIIEGAMIAAFIYATPLRSNDIYTALIQFLILPLLIISGLVMWQLPRLNKWRNTRNRPVNAR